MTESITEHIASLTGAGPTPEDAQSTDLQDVSVEDRTKLGAIDQLSDPRNVETGVEQPMDPDYPGPEESSEPDRDELIRAADGRLNEIVTLRQQLSGMNSRMEDMRQLVLEATEPDPIDERAREVEIYGEDVVDHPSVRLISDRMRAELDERIPRSDPQQAQAQEEFQQVMHATQTSINAFKESHPNYDQAYLHARNERRKMYAHLPPAEQENQLNRDELGFTVSLLQAGKDPATEMWALAQRVGFNPSAPAAVTDTDVEKVRAGVRQSKVSSVGGRSAKRGDVITMAIYKAMPRDQRMEIAGNQDKFEQLMRTGSTTFD